jgi:uncharacterized protein YbjQ (UPF0145 family)
MMKLSTTENIDESKYEILGLVDGIHIITLSGMRKIISGLSGIFGSNRNYSGIEEKFLETRAQAIYKMQDNAKRLGADEVIGIRVDISEVGPSETVLVALAYGTAVRLKQKGGLRRGAKKNVAKKKDVKKKDDIKRVVKKVVKK